LSIHADEDLPGLDALTFLDQDFLDDAGVGGLDDLDVGLRNEPAFGTGDDVQFAEGSPD